MSTLLELLINGISLGVVYALVALGFVMIFKATRTVNFAHASFIVLGAWLVAVFAERVGFWLALLGGIVVVGLVALVIERLLLSRIDIRDHATATILTLAVNILLVAELTRRLKEHIVPIGTPWGSNVLHFAGISVPASRIANMVVALIVIGLLTLALLKTRWGLSTRATIQDPEASALVGIRMSRVTATAWIIGGVLAVIAGVGLASYPAPGVSLGSQVAALKAFPAAIIGGLDSFVGAIVGGMLIGLTEVTVATYGSELDFLGDGLGDVAAYVLMIAVLLWRPQGLFGSKELQRV